MAMVTTNDQHYRDIAAALREKTGGTETYTPAQMAAAIANLSTGSAAFVSGQVSAGTHTIDTGLSRIDKLIVVADNMRSDGKLGVKLLTYPGTTAKSLDYANMTALNGSTLVFNRVTSSYWNNHASISGGVFTWKYHSFGPPYSFSDTMYYLAWGE